MNGREDAERAQSKQQLEASASSRCPACGARPLAGEAAALVAIGDALRDGFADLVAGLAEITEAVETLRGDLEAELDAVRTELGEVQRSVVKYGS
jgi:hypothetical protein